MSGSFLAACAGDSMSPTLDRRDLVEVQPFVHRPVGAGDVVWLGCANGPVIHRVLAVVGRRLITCGDNNRRADSLLIDQDAVVGRVVAAWRGRQCRLIAGGLRELVRRRCGRWYFAASEYLLLKGVRSRELSPTPTQVPTMVLIGNGEALLYLGELLAGWFNPTHNRWQLGTWAKPLLEQVVLPVPEVTSV